MAVVIWRDVGEAITEACEYQVLRDSFRAWVDDRIRAERQAQGDNR